MTTLKGPRSARAAWAGEIEIDAGHASLDSPDHRPGDGPPPATPTPSSSIGNPHCVIEVDDPDALDLPAVGAPIERHPVVPEPRERRVLPAARDGHSIRMRVFERGAGETLSSGSGSSAAAVAAVVAGPRDLTGDGAHRWRHAAGRRLGRPRRQADRPGRADHDRPVLGGLPSHPGGASVRYAAASQPAAAVPVRGARAQDRREARRGRRRHLAGHRRPRHPDLPGRLVEEMQRQVAPAGHPPVPVEPRAARSSGRRWRASTSAASASTLDPETEVLPAARRQGGDRSRLLAMLDPGDVCLAADPGYPVYTSGPLLAGAEPRTDAAAGRERASSPTSTSIPAGRAEPARTCCSATTRTTRPAP